MQHSELKSLWLQGRHVCAADGLSSDSVRQFLDRASEAMLADAAMIVATAPGCPDRFAEDLIDYMRRRGVSSNCSALEIIYDIRHLQTLPRDRGRELLLDCIDGADALRVLAVARSMAATELADEHVDKRMMEFASQLEGGVVVSDRYGVRHVIELECLRRIGRILKWLNVD